MSDSTKYTTLHPAHPQGQSARPKWQSALLFIGGVVALSWVYTTFVPSSTPEPQFLAKKVRMCLLRSSTWSAFFHFGSGFILVQAAQLGA